MRSPAMWVPLGGPVARSSGPPAAGEGIGEWLEHHRGPRVGQGTGHRGEGPWPGTRRTRGQVQGRQRRVAARAANSVSRTGHLWSNKSVSGAPASSCSGAWRGFAAGLLACSRPAIPPATPITADDRSLLVERPGQRPNGGPGRVAVIGIGSPRARLGSVRVAPKASMTWCTSGRTSSSAGVAVRLERLAERVQRQPVQPQPRGLRCVIPRR